MTTAAFLATIDPKTKAEILDNIARHYGVTPQEAFEEITAIDEDTQHLLDYMTGAARTATSLLMKRHGFAA